MKKNMIPLYQSELSVEGLADKIQAQSSIAYLAPVILEKLEFDNEKILKTIAGLSLASENDSDLYVTKSILVTTDWNKNTDVFDPKETWAARYTPVHKPTNIDHDEHKLCGHITSVWAIDSEGQIVPDNTSIEDIPKLFHLVNAAVIYLNWSDEELTGRTQKLIAEIKEGKKFVSMEALFTDFDYAAIKIDDPSDSKVIARNNENAWMTKHLRAYGGTGEVEGYKIGRLLKNITFCGKGYVDKPANPNSIIFAKEEKKVEIIESNKKSGVYSGSKIEIKGEDMNPDELQSKNEELVKANTDLDKKVKDVETEVAQLKEQLKAKENSVLEAAAKIDELIKANTDLTDELKKVKAAELKANRVAKLVDGGIAKDVAEKKVDIFSCLTDEQFGVIADEMVAAAKAIKQAAEKPVEGKCDEKKDEEEEEDSKGEEVVDQTNLDKPVETQDTNLTASSETVNASEIEKVRQELADVITGIVSKKRVKK